MGESVYLSLPVNSTGSSGLPVAFAGRSVAKSYGREKVSSAYGIYGPNSSPEFDLLGIIVIARDVYGRQMAGLIIIAVPRDYIQSPLQKPEPYIPFSAQKASYPSIPERVPAFSDTRVTFDGVAPDQAVSSAVSACLDKLPFEQRQSVRRAVISDIDGPGGIMGAYSPSRRGEINIDGSDVGYNIAKTVAHESFHSFTCQSLLALFERYAKTGVSSDPKGYGKSMKGLWDLYAEAQRKRDMRAFPTDYSRSCVSKVYGARSYDEAKQAASVGFMEYLAELASELETKGQSVKANASPELRQAYGIMEGILRSADSDSSSLVA